MSDDTPSPLNNVITIDDERIKSHLERVVRGTVEETLNALLDAEADRLCNAQRYERSAARRDTRAGHYERGLQTKAGEVRLRVPKLRRQTFETAIIERYRRRESSVEDDPTRALPDRSIFHIRSNGRRGFGSRAKSSASALAARRLITSSNLVGCSISNSEGCGNIWSTL